MSYYDPRPPLQRFLDMTWGEIHAEQSEASRAFLRLRHMDPEGGFITTDYHKGRRVTVRAWDRLARLHSYRLQCALRKYCPATHGTPTA